MVISKYITERSGSRCECCSSSDDLRILNLVHNTNDDDARVLICSNCGNIAENPTQANEHHARILSESIWSEVSAVKAFSYRTLSLLNQFTWANESVENAYLTDEEMNLARAGMNLGTIPTLDSNGISLSAGDTVVLIKDLDVKGSTITAKRGTAVRNIKLVHNDPTLIEGKVDGQTIYIIAAFTKK